MTQTPSPTPLTLEPAVARGVTPGIALRGMLDLAGSTDEQRQTWLANANVSVLGQLAVTPPQTSQNVLGAVCAVAASKRSVRGMEPVLLSAALGTDPGTHEQVTAAETWSRYAAPTPGLLTPVINPRTRELVFLSAGEVVEAAGSRSGMQAGLLAFLASSDEPRRGAPAHKEAERIFANALALAAGAVGAASTDAGLAGAGASQALPDKLAAGNALLVEVIVSQPHPSTTGSHAGANGSGLAVPGFPLLGDDGPAPHPFWTASFRCSTTIPADSWLPTLMIDRGRSYVLGAVPHAGGGQTSAAAPGTSPGSGSTGRGRGYLPAAVPTRSGASPATAVRVTPQYVTYAPILNPLTGQPAYYGLYPPGYAPPAGTQPPSLVPLHPQPGEVTRLLTQSVRTLQLSTETPVGRVVEAINASEYGVALNRATLVLRGYA